MKRMAFYLTSHFLVKACFVLVLLVVGHNLPAPSAVGAWDPTEENSPAASPSPHPTYRAPTYGEITPGPHKIVGDLSTTIEIPPFPYGAPLPPPLPSVLDGLYSKMVPLEGTPVPCKRCAGYRLEGGLWTLYFDKGMFRVFQQDTDFETVGSFVVSGNRLTLFNDPYCDEELKTMGIYQWTLEGSTLTLAALDDGCSIHLRAKNLTSAPWVKTPIDPKERAAACQPPTREAAVTDHWSKPPFCK